MKKAVLLLNLGSPDSTSVSDVRRYLREFLMDERVIDAPFWVRWMVVNLFILPSRPKKSAEAYENVWTADGSPLIAVSKQFSKLVSDKLDIPVYLGMRYGNPSTVSQIKQMKKDGIEQVLIFPLYPHYAMSSYESALVCATDAISEFAPHMNYEVVNPFYADDDYIDCLVDQSQLYLDKSFDHLLFSFHGIPERHLVKSDPSGSHCLKKEGCCQRKHPAHATCYRHQCFETVRKFVEKTGLTDDQYSVSFQSRLGRDPWLKPYTDFRLKELPQEGKKRVIIISPAFVTDCLETIEELSMEGKSMFLDAGGLEFDQIPCLNLNQKWIDFACSQVRKFEQNNTPPV